MHASQLKPRRRVRILIVGDHPLVRAGFRALISNETDLQVCGEAASLVEAIEQIKECTPDVVVVHLYLASGSGLELIKRLHARDSSMRMLVCSMQEESLFVERTLRAGAQGYINENEIADHVVEAVQRVMSGGIYLSAHTSQRMLLNKLEVGTDSVNNLSDRELEVFSLIGQGVGTSQIAGRLHLSVKTVESHREKIKRKLNLASAGELTRYAMKWALEHH